MAVRSAFPAYVEASLMSQTLLIAWLLGAPGVAAGALVGALRVRPPGFLAKAWAFGLLLGLIAGGVLAYGIWHSIATSDSANAPLAIGFVPLPLLTNGIGGGWAAVVCREWADRRAAR
jgi:hypothetical protein